MSGTSPGRRLRSSLLPLIAFSLVAALLSGRPAVAHTFTKSDGNDSPSKLDIRSASVRHAPNGAVVHTVRTYGGWTAKSLGNDSFFVFQFDKNNDRTYERCAFIFFGSGKLRGSLSNCRSKFIRGLPVQKTSTTTAKITVPKTELTPAYWWAAVSIWDGPAPCANGCVDFAPNRFPDILHDLQPPTITMADTPLRVWEGSADAVFPYPFSLSDAHSGVKTWRVEARPLETSSWTLAASGTGQGSKNPTIDSLGPGRYQSRVVAVDKQGNQKIASRLIYLPTDDTLLAPGDFTGTPSTVMNAAAFGGSYQELDSGEAVTFTLASFADCEFELVGPGSGTWQVDVTLNGSPFVSLDAANFADDQRQTLFDILGCTDPATLTFTVTAGTGFGVDAFLPPA